MTKVLVIQNNLRRGGLITYADQLCLGLREMVSRGEVEYSQVVPYYLLESHGHLPGVEPTYITKSDAIMCSNETAYKSHLQWADKIIVVAPANPTGLELLSPEEVAEKDITVVIHSVDDIVRSRNFEGYQSHSALRLPYVSTYVLYRRKLGNSISKIADKFNWPHLRNGNKRFLLSHMGHHLNDSAQLPSVKISKYGLRGAWWGRAVNAQKRYTRIIEGLSSNNPFKKVYFAFNMSGDSGPMSERRPLLDAESNIDNVYLVRDFDSTNIHDTLDKCSVALLPSEYKDNGYPLEWVVQEAITNMLVPLVVESVASECEKFAPGFKFITVPNGWEDIDFSIFSDMTSEYLDQIAINNYSLFSGKYSPYMLAKNIVDKITVHEALDGR